MTEQLHRLIDSKVPQGQINERIAAIMEKDRSDMNEIRASLDRIGSDHEKRLRYLERTVAWALGGIGVISALIMVISKVVK